MHRSVFLLNHSRASTVPSRPTSVLLPQVSRESLRNAADSTEDLNVIQLPITPSVVELALAWSRC